MAQCSWGQPKIAGILILLFSPHHITRMIIWIYLLLTRSVTYGHLKFSFPIVAVIAVTLLCYHTVLMVKLIGRLLMTESSRVSARYVQMTYGMGLPISLVQSTQAAVAPETRERSSLLARYLLRAIAGNL